LIATACLVTAISSLVGDYWPSAPVVSITVHLGIVAVLVLGAIFDDELGETLRACGACLLVGASVSILSGEPRIREGIPTTLISVYPAGIAVIALIYGRLVGGWPFYAVSGSIAMVLSVIFGGRFYVALRQHVSGLDRIAWGLASFLVAAIISLWKAGVPQRWLAKRAPIEAITQASSDTNTS
jgi:hypothetical protein